MNLSSLEPDDQKKLVELAYLGEWLINAHHDNDFQDEAATAAFQRLLASVNLPEVQRDPETREFFLSSEWVDRIYDQYILDYDDHVFWDELTERLAQRDLARRRGVRPEQINREDHIRQLKPLEERYRQELEEHGIDRLEIADDF